MTDAVAFWSVILPANGKEVRQEIESTETVVSTIHVTGMALGPQPKKGSHVITLEYNGVNAVLATLEDPHTRQFHMDIVVDQTAKFRNSGGSEVHLYGYHVSTPVRSEEEDEEEDEDEEGEGEEDEEGEDGDEEEDEEGEGEEFDEEEEARRIAQLAPILEALERRAAERAAKKAGFTGNKMETSEDGDEDEDDEDEDEGEDGIPDLDQLGSDDLIGLAGEDEDEDEDEEESEEEEEQAPPPKVGAKRGAQTPQPSKPTKQAKQEPQTAPPKQAGKGAKQAPAPAAEAKGVKGKGAAKETPTKGVATPGSEAEFKAALVAHLKGSKGPVPVSQLGSAIKRPAAVPKLSAYLASNKDTFAYDSSKQTVTLKKK